MYPSININDGLQALRTVLLEFRNENQLKNVSFTLKEIDFIIDLAKWVLNNNFFEFGIKTFFHQLKGTAMGTPFAVTFACIYLSTIENKTKQLLIVNYNFQPIFYKRYIDDLFAIFKNTSEAMKFVKVFNKIKQNQIKLVITHIGDNVQFLDIEIFKGIRFLNENLLDSKIFQKAQCRYLYLPPSSFHRKSVFNSFINAEIKRYRLLNSNDDDYKLIKHNFYQRLLDRGYNNLQLDKLFNKDYSRKSLMLNIMNNNSVIKCIQPPILFQTVFTPRHMNIDFKKCLQYTEAIWMDPRSSRVILNKTTHPTLCFKKSKTLGEYLTSASYKYNIIK
jgi:hypothetical protein